MPTLRFAVFLLLTALAGSPALASERIDLVLVEKSARMLHLMAGERRLRSYSVALGFEPEGHKQREGDGRTPEGLYVLDWRNAGSGYYRSIHISYPDADDRAAAAALGVSPGGDIMIHGQRNGFGWLSVLTQNFDWTNGCIALADADMLEVWTMVAKGTPIEIRP